MHGFCRCPALEEWQWLEHKLSVIFHIFLSRSLLTWSWDATMQKQSHPHLFSSVRAAGVEFNHTSRNHPKGWKHIVEISMQHLLVAGERKIENMRENCPNKTVINQLNLRGLKCTLAMTWKCFSRSRRNFSLHLWWMDLTSRVFRWTFLSSLVVLWITATAGNDKSRSVWTSNIIKTLTHFCLHCFIRIFSTESESHWQSKWKIM